MASEVLEKGDKVKFRFDSIYVQIAPDEIGEVLNVRGNQVQVSFKQLGVKDIYSVHEFVKIKQFRPQYEPKKGDTVSLASGKLFTTSQGQFAYGTIVDERIGVSGLAYDIGFELHGIANLKFRTSATLQPHIIQTEGVSFKQRFQSLPENANDKELKAFRNQFLASGITPLTELGSFYDRTQRQREVEHNRRHQPTIIDHLSVLTREPVTNSINNNPVNKKQDGQQGESYNVPGKHFSVREGEKREGEAFSSQESEAKFAIGHFSYGGEAFRS